MRQTKHGRWSGIFSYAGKGTSMINVVSFNNRKLALLVEPVSPSLSTKVSRIFALKTLVKLTYFLHSRPALDRII